MRVDRLVKNHENNLHVKDLKENTPSKKKIIFILPPVDK